MTQSVDELLLEIWNLQTELDLALTVIRGLGTLKDAVFAEGLADTNTFGILFNLLDTYYAQSKEIE